jgi:hypothetical protein
MLGCLWKLRTNVLKLETKPNNNLSIYEDLTDNI